MDNVEVQVQKHLVSFCKALPVHVGCWRMLLQESVKPVQSLANLSEQQRSIQNVKVFHFEGFDDAQSVLLYQISTRIEEELTCLKKLLDKLNEFNMELKNKLLVLERSTLNLNWEQNSELIRGNGSQIALARLLQSGLEFLTFFSTKAKSISDCFKSLDLKDEKSVKELQNSFDINVDDKVVTDLLALTQYVDNENNII